jgi:TPR repeat protein
LTETDADALANAAYCLQHGVGTEKDLTKAAHFYLTAARKFGHFTSVRLMGVMYMEVSIIISEY